jgi:hypothetical protein
MNLLLLLLAAQASEQPVVRRETFSTRTRGPQVTKEIIPFVKRYYDCLYPPGVVTSTKAAGKSNAQIAQDRLDACKETREWAVTGSIRVYKPGRGDRRSAKKFVGQAFETIDQGHITQARFVDDLVAGRAQLPDDRSKPININQPPPETDAK